MIRIETEEIGNNGLQKICGFVNDYNVITLSDGILDNKGIGIWSVSDSCAIPVNLEKAKMMIECIRQVFAKLDEVNNNLLT